MSAEGAAARCSRNGGGVAFTRRAARDAREGGDKLICFCGGGGEADLRSKGGEVVILGFGDGAGRRAEEAIGGGVPPRSPRSGVVIY